MARIATDLPALVAKHPTAIRRLVDLLVDETTAAVVELHSRRKRKVRRYFHPRRVNAVAVRPDGLVMIGDVDGRVVLLREPLRGS